MISSIPNSVKSLKWYLVLDKVIQEKNLVLYKYYHFLIIYPVTWKSHILLKLILIDIYIYSILDFLTI